MDPVRRRSRSRSRCRPFYRANLKTGPSTEADAQYEKARSRFLSSPIKAGELDVPTVGMKWLKLANETLATVTWWEILDRCDDEGVCNAQKGLLVVAVQHGSFDSRATGVLEETKVSH